jgi:hypothetical protein
MTFAPLPNKGLVDVAKSVGTGIWDRTLGRLMGSGIQKNSRIHRATAKWSGRSATKDWRVKLQIPQRSPLNKEFFDNEIFEPLREGNGILWPINPSIIYQHTTNYTAMAQTHSNYPFQAYQNSMPNDMNIVGEFIVQNWEDARYWVATVNFLRAVHKMFFGGSDDNKFKGNPPPILHMSGYGDHMFNKVPVVLNNFNVDLRAGIDYICTQQDNYYGGNGAERPPDQIAYATWQDIPATWAPTNSLVSVMVTPIYSRDAVKKFTMQKFLDGSLSRETGVGWL